MSGERLPFGPGVLVLGAGALFLLAVMAVGFLLPTDWEATAERRIDAPADVVYPYLASPEGWRRWTTWPDSGVTREGPASGAGATLRWDDEELGNGSFRIETVRPDRSVSYAVDIYDGAMRTRGTMELTPEGGGVRVAWREEGNLGRNPLMGFWAPFMDEAQTAELEKSLDRLAEVVVDVGSSDADAARADSLAGS